jgi:hypothetical protein
MAEVPATAAVWFVTGCSPPRPHSVADIGPSCRRQRIGRLSSPRSVVGNLLRESHTHRPGVHFDALCHVVHLLYRRQNSERMTLLGNREGKMLLSHPGDRQLRRLPITLLHAFGQQGSTHLVPRPRQLTPLMSRFSIEGCGPFALRMWWLQPIPGKIGRRNQCRLPFPARSASAQRQE